MTNKVYFPNLGKIPFEGKDSKNPLAFHYYNPEQVVDYAKTKGEPKQTSGKQELYEAIVNMYI